MDRTGRHHDLLNLIMAPIKKTTAATADNAADPEAASTTTIPTALPTFTPTDIRTLILSWKCLQPSPKVRIPFPLPPHLSLSPAQQLTLSGADEC